MGIKAYLIVGAACLAVGAAGGGRAAWVAQDGNVAKLKLAAAQAEADAFALGWAKERAANKITNAAETGAVKAQEVIRWRTTTLIKRIPLYVTPEADGRCIVPVGAVRLFNDAASGRSVPDAAPSPHDPPADRPDAPRARGGGGER
jgi:hypothetical protein